MSERTFERISLFDALAAGPGHVHASHCFLYCASEWRGHRCKFVLMQLRFDGKLGFPGGLVDEDVKDVQHLVDAANRELAEELNFTDNVVVESDYAFSHLFESSSRKKDHRLIAHFFVKELTEDTFEAIESGARQSIHFPEEQLGLVRIPVVDSPNSSSDKFMNSFLLNQFAGNARHQFELASESLKKKAEPMSNGSH